MALPGSLTTQSRGIENRDIQAEADHRKVHYLISLLQTFDFTGQRSVPYSRNVFPRARICSLDNSYYEGRNWSEQYLREGGTYTAVKEYTAWAQWREIISISSNSGLGFIGLYALTGMPEQTVFLVEKAILPIFNKEGEVLEGEIDPGMLLAELYDYVAERATAKALKKNMGDINAAVLKTAESVARDILTGLQRFRSVIMERVQKTESELQAAAAGRPGKAMLDSRDLRDYELLGLKPKFDPNDFQERQKDAKKKKHQEAADEDKVRCVWCAEWIMPQAKVCRYCQLSQLEEDRTLVANKLRKENKDAPVK